MNMELTESAIHMSFAHWKETLRQSIRMTVFNLRATRQTLIEQGKDPEEAEAIATERAFRSTDNRNYLSPEEQEKKDGTWERRIREKEKAAQEKIRQEELAKQEAALKERRQEEEVQQGEVTRKVVGRIEGLAGSGAG